MIEDVSALTTHARCRTTSTTGALLGRTFSTRLEHQVRRRPTAGEAPRNARREAFNLTNSVIFGTPDTDLSNPSAFGVISGTANGALKLQGVAKVIFQIAIRCSGVRWRRIDGHRS